MGKGQKTGVYLVREMHMIGIDLGTTNSLVCVWEEAHVRLLENCFGEKLTPPW